MALVRVGLVAAALVGMVAACGAEEVTSGRPSKTRIAFTASPHGPWATWVVRADGTGFARFSEPQRRSRRTELGPVWSPDGRRLAFTAHLNRYGDGGFVGGGADYDVYVMDTARGHARNLTAGPRVRDAGDFDWSPDATRIVLSGWDRQRQHHRVYIVGADAGDGVTDLTEGTTDDAAPSWSPDGTRIAFLRAERGARGAVYTIAPNGEDLRRLVASNTGGVWSPDGKWIAFNRGGRRAGMYITDVRGRSHTKLTDTPGIPAWSPDGNEIAYDAYRRGSSDIYVVDTRTRRRLRLSHDPGDEVSPGWSPSGAKIAYSRSPVSGPADNTGTYDVYLMNADGTGQRRLTDCRCLLGGGLSWQPRSRDP
jgi:TolB protein